MLGRFLICAAIGLSVLAACSTGGLSLDPVTVTIEKPAPKPTGVTAPDRPLGS